MLITSETYSLNAYRSLLRLALAEGYRFCSFLDEPDGEGRRIYLRHDVDYSLGVASQLARVNQEEGVQGTFCVLLRSQIYNLLSYSELARAESLLALGQRLALHAVVPEPAPEGDAALAQFVLGEFALASRLLPGMDGAFSWHNPTPEVFERGLSFEAPGLVNMYSARFVKDISYYSDTNLRHSVAEFRGILRRGTPALQLLIHPINWVAEESTMLGVLARTWKSIIREREEDVRTNRIYAAHFADGMPDAILDALAGALAAGSLREQQQAG
ncbi:MAG TPA: hypothetical protein VF157_06730 [Chloroflexota bacterium]